MDAIPIEDRLRRMRVRTDYVTSEVHEAANAIADLKLALGLMIQIVTQGGSSRAEEDAVVASARNLLTNI